MSNDSSGEAVEQCYNCGEPDPELSAMDQNGVMRPWCRRCFMKRNSDADRLKQILSDWRLLFVGGLLLVLVGASMIVGTVEQVVEMPAWSYLALGLFGVGMGIRRLRKARAE